MFHAGICSRIAFVLLYDGVALVTSECFLEASIANMRVSHTAEAALRERVKELTCLYGIAQVINTSGLPLAEILQRIAELIPPSWQYPEVTSARITVDSYSYSTPGFVESGQKQSADIVVDGTSHGIVEVVYLEERPLLDEGPFLREERDLINAIAGHVASIMEHRRGEEDRLKLEVQIRHADRLATIGLLAAGVAHELNEPVGIILGFAQLAKKCEGLPESARDDIEKIEFASLHAREVIKKLLIFARETPSERTCVNLNDVVKDGLHFFEARCAKHDIEVIRLLSPDLPGIAADPGQMSQALVNLAVNALQAMPEGGKLTLQTQVCDDGVCLIVEDTGEGMSKETLDQIFTPFFTTKDVGQGTGLGLSVVHGIVTAHDGTIDVKSEEGCGTRFEIRLPTLSTCGAKEKDQNV